MSSSGAICAFTPQDGKLMGAITARYQTSGPDSVAHLRLEGTRAP